MPTAEEYVDTMVAVAERDPTIAKMLREICALDDAVRGPALDLVSAHLRTHAAAADVLECVHALRRDDVARAIVARLGAP